MRRVYLATAFSLAMLSRLPVMVKISEIKRNEIPENFINAVGHESTAKVISRILGKEISANRVNITLEPGDVLIVFQIYRRPKEGQVYTQEEIEEIVNQGLYKLVKVEVLG